MTDIWQAPDPTRITKGAGLNYVDRPDMEAALQRVRKGEDDWVVLAYVKGSSDTLVKLAAGSGGASVAAEHLTPDMYAYALIRLIDMYDGLPTTRFCLVIWVGDNLSGILKARIAATRATAYSFIGHYNVDITASEKAEIADDVVAAKISSASGSASKVVSRMQAEKMQEAGSLASSAKPKANEFVPKDRPPFNYVDEAGIRSALADVRSDASSTDWALLGYQGADVALVAKGSGGRAELAENLKPTEIMYALLRVYDTIDATTQARFVFVDFLGENVSPLKRGKITTHKGRIEKLIEAHTTIRAGSPDELSDDAITDRLNELKGGRN